MRGCGRKWRAIAVSLHERSQPYRLSGDLLDHLCVAHLTGKMRVIVAFEAADIAYIVLVGDHDSRQPPLDVYQQLYAVAGARATRPGRPEQATTRRHPDRPATP